MGISQKTIRSTSWKTDMVIGFPDGLLLLFFTTQVLYAAAISVQQFYTLHLAIIALGTVFMMLTAFMANRGDHHDEGTMSPEEKRKLQHLEISGDTIDHITVEMKEDQQKWEQMLAKENVQTTSYRTVHAVRSMLVTGLFFFLGGFVALMPFLMQEDFNVAAKSGIYVAGISLLIFAFLKSRFTSQKPGIVMLRLMLTGVMVYFAAWLLAQVFF